MLWTKCFCIGTPLSRCASMNVRAPTLGLLGVGLRPRIGGASGVPSGKNHPKRMKFPRRLTA
jgi:hypothetical protein